MMIFSTFSKKTIIATTLSFLCVLLVVLVYMFFIRTAKQDMPEPSPIEDSLVKKVFIGNFDDYKGSIKPEIQETIENNLYSHTRKDTPDLYTGIIREGSYSKKTINTLTRTEFLVDIEPTNIAYLVVISTVNNNSAVEVRCPTQDKQLHQSAICVPGAME